MTALAKSAKWLALILGLGAASGGCRRNVALPDLLGQPPPAPTASQSARASGTAPPPDPAGMRRVDLAAPRRASLAYDIRPTSGGALLVAADLLRRHSWVRRAADDGLSPVRALRGRFAVELLGDLLLSSTGSELCAERFETLDDTPSDTPSDTVHCHALGADAAVLLAGRPALIEQRAEPREDDDAARDDKPARVRIWIHPLKADGTRDGAPIDSALTFAPPLPDMGLMDAVGTHSGARLLFYDHRPDKRVGGKGVARAALSSARVDADGKLVEPSRELLFEGERAFGRIEGHGDPRLFTNGRRAIYVGRAIDSDGKESFEARSLGSVRRSIAAEQHVLAIDPWRYTEARDIDAVEIEALRQLWQQAPRLSLRQRPSRAARVAWGTERGYFMVDGELRSAARADGSVRVEAAPFESTRSPIHWAAWTPRGEALALLGDSLAEVDAAGEVTTHAVERDLTAPHAEAAKVGDSWWIAAPAANASGTALVRLTPSVAEIATVALYADAVALAGGVDAGMLLTAREGQLLVWRIGADGAIAFLSRHTTPLARGFVATERRAGGALVAGVSRDGKRVVVLAIDAGGALLGVHDAAVPIGAVRLYAQHGGGAWLSDVARTHVSWHDDDGRPLGHAAWPRGDNGLACVDGEAARREVPLAGSMGESAAFAASGACVVGPIASLPGGEQRWLGAKVAALHSQAELVRMTTDAGANGAATNRATTVSAPSANAVPPAPGRCSSDMVLVRGSVCVDRFEAQLVDAASGVALSPDHPLAASLVHLTLDVWLAGRWDVGDLHARAMPLPPLGRAPDDAPSAVARSRQGAVPSGYVDAFVAKRACVAAGKRLCSAEEWTTACRGEQDRKYPYGDDYEHGACNVFRYAHPAAALHNNASVGHLDPRLNHVLDGGETMRRRTGATPRCHSRWGDDAIYDMVGNLDEWVETKSGGFAGGFYSRPTRNGCASLITAHPRRYLDYSLGIRCCADPR